MFKITIEDGDVKDCRCYGDGRQIFTYTIDNIDVAKVIQAILTIQEEAKPKLTTAVGYVPFNDVP